MATRRTAAEWSEIVDSFKKSGQSISAWCKEHGFSEKTMGAHVRAEGKTRSKGIRNAQEWGELIAEQKQSGLGRGEWCKKHGVSADLMTKAESRQKARDAREKDSAGQAWVPLTTGEQESIPVGKTEETGWGVRIRSNGLEIEVHADYPATKLAALLERLVKSCQEMASRYTWPAARQT